MASQKALQKLGFPSGATGATPSPTPAITTMPKKAITPTSKATPVQKTGYNPIETFKTNINETKRKATAGLGALGTILSTPSRTLGTSLKGAYEGAEKTKSLKGWGEGLISGAKTGFLNKQGSVTGGQYLTDTVLKDKIKNPYAKAGVEFGTDIVTDPLNFVGMGLLSKGNQAFKSSKIGTKIMPVVKAIEQSKPVQKVKDTLGKFQYGYGLSPRTLKKYENLQTELGKAGKYAESVASPLKYAADGTELPKETQRLLGYVKNLMEEAPNRPLRSDELKALEVAEPVLKKLFGQFEDLAQQAKKYGIDPEVFSKRIGKYGGRKMYLATAGKGKGVGGIATDVSQYMKRKNLSPGKVRKLGEITEPAYGAAQAAYSQKRNVEILKFFKDIAKENAVSRQGFEALDDATKAKYVFIPKDTKYGVLSGSYIPKQVAEYIKPIVKQAPTGLNKALESFTKVWKPMKTVMSPAQLGRNTITSQIQAFLENPKALLALPKALREKVTKGKFYKALEATGELRGSPGIELQQFVPDEVAKMGGGVKSKLSQAWELAKKPGSSYQQGNETVAKLQSFIARISEDAADLGISVDKALERPDLIEKARKSAEAAAFNYTKVSPLVNKLRKGAVPFITYPLKAAELTGKTLVRNPERLAALQKAEQAAMNVTEENAPDEKYLPSYINQAVRVGKPDKKGSSAYLNTKYLYPWGNLTDVASGDEKFNAWTNIGISPNPLISEAYTQLAGKDIFGTSIKGKEIRHAAETLGPSFVRTAGKMRDALTKNQTSSIAMKPSELALKEVGIPYYKYNPEQGADWASYDKSQKISEVKKAMKAYVRDYEGKKSQEQIDKKLEEYYKQIEKISSE